MRVAVLFNPGAGNSAVYSEVGIFLSEALKSHEVITLNGSCAEVFLPGSLAVEYSQGNDYKQRIRGMVLALLEAEPELFICIGGDGTASYAATTIIEQKLKLPMLGIACGTANVGPIVTVGVKDIKVFDPDNLKIKEAGAIRVIIGEKLAGYGFNDVVIGNTLLGTVNGEMCTLSAEAMAHNGAKLLQEPDTDITEDDFTIEKNGCPVLYSIAKPGQIVISPLEADNFFGRAVTGALCMSAYTDKKAAVALTKKALIKTSQDSDGIDSFSCVEHLLFGPGDAVYIKGLSNKAHVMIDGNPHIRRAGETVTLEYTPGVVKIARLK